MSNPAGSLPSRSSRLNTRSRIPSQDFWDSGHNHKHSERAFCKISEVADFSVGGTGALGRWGIAKPAPYVAAGRPSLTPVHPNPNGRAGLVPGSANGAMLLRIRRRERAATVEMIGTELRSIATAARCSAIAPPPAWEESKRFARSGIPRDLRCTRADLIMMFQTSDWTRRRDPVIRNAGRPTSRDPSTGLRTPCWFCAVPVPDVAATSSQLCQTLARLTAAPCHGGGLGTPRSGAMLFSRCS